MPPAGSAGTGGRPTGGPFIATDLPPPVTWPSHLPGAFLREACLEGHVEVVRVLLAEGADKEKGRTEDGTTPLWIACHNDNVEVVRAAGKTRWCLTEVIHFYTDF